MAGEGPGDTEPVRGPGPDDATTAATVAHLRAEHLAAVGHPQTVAAIQQEA
jgi:hypothetical protein